MEEGASIPTNGNGPAHDHARRTPDARTGRTAAEILASDEPEVAYLPLLGRDGFTVDGWMHLLAAGPKVGKTSLVAQAVVPWLRLGRSVLWLSEESGSLWKERLVDLASTFGRRVPWERLVVEQTMGREPRDLLDLARASSADIVIGDTLRHIAGMRDENDAAEVRLCVAPWLAAMRLAGKTFIASHHHRKGQGDDSGEQVAGSHALVGLFDVILELRRVDSHPSRRKLTGRSRLREVPTVIIERDDDARMIVLGDGRSVSRQDAERRACEVVNAAAEPLTTRQVHEGWGRGDSSDTTTARRALEGALKKGLIGRIPPLGADTERVTLRWVAIDLLSGGNE